MRVIILQEDTAEAVSDIIHRAEEGGFELTEFEDEMWATLTEAIRKATEVL